MSAMDRLDQIEARAQAATQALTTGTTGTPPNIDGLSTADALGILGDAATDVPALVAAVRAVLDKHRARTYAGLVMGVCDHCRAPADGSVPWPCPTAQAVTDALGGERA